MAATFRFNRIHIGNLIAYLFVCCTFRQAFSTCHRILIELS